jgi:predicted transport protein
MIKSANQYPISQILDGDSKIIYTIPKYQREYTWTKTEWEELFDDLYENDMGYYLGSIICVNQSKDAISAQYLEIIDGQQRLTTIILLFAAIYSRISDNKLNLTDNQMVDIINLKNRIVLKREKKVRFVLQDQNNNNDDFLAILNECDIFQYGKAPKNLGNRKIYHAYKYFKARISSLIDNQNNGIDLIIDYLGKITSACIVKIEVESYTDAFILFESLNNRGTPLSVVDLIKNSLLKEFEKSEKGSIDIYYEKWKELLEYLGDDYTVQERFFRYYYDAFKTELQRIYSVSVATRSNLIHIYETLINYDAKTFLKDIICAGKMYAHILGRSDDGTLEKLIDDFTDLEHIQGSPSHVLLLYLLVKKDILDLDENILSSIIKNLVNFFVHRNITDVPPTRDLIRLFMNTIEKIKDMKGPAIQKEIAEQLKIVSENDDVFKEKLKGPLYDQNKETTRFILCSLEESDKTRENKVNLWEYKGKQMVWTIEHIFPEGENIPRHWVDMIADGDTKKAKEIQESHVHKLGNLSISAYNSNLSARSFEDKKNLVDASGRNIGYRNGIKLNEDLVTKDTWNEKTIDERTDKLVSLTLELFKL